MRAGRWVGVLAAAAALGGVISPAGAATETVKLEGLAFKPREMTIDAGDTVRWEYVSGGNHTVTFDDGSYDSNPNCVATLQINCFKQGDEPKRRTFEAPGTFPYYCRVHGGPNGQGMAGVVEVKGTSDSSTTSATATPVTAGGSGASTSTTETTVESTTTTTRELATSSTVILSTTTTVPEASTATFAPAEAPLLDPEDIPEVGDTETEAAGQAGDDGDGGGSVVPAIVGLLLAVAGGGGALLWRLRPGRSGRGPKP